MKLRTLAIAAIAAAGAMAPANAAYYALNYTATDGSPLPTTAAFRIQTSDVLNGSGGFDILAASGSFTAGGITTNVTGLAPINPPGFNTDNVFYTTDPVFTSAGLGVLTSVGTANMWGTAPGAYTFYAFTNGGYNVATDGTLAITAATGVPEADIWAMLVAGFGLVGIAARRRTTAVAA